MYRPYEYDKINLAMSTYSPNAIHNCDNEAFYFWQRALFQRIQSVYKIEDIPDSWRGPVEDFLDYLLISFGYCIVAKDDKYGPYFSAAALSGFNLYYQPTKAVLNNPDSKLTGKSLKIGTDCELLKLTPDYRGLLDIIDYYAEKLALLDTSVNTNLINSKLPFYLFADSKAAAQSIKAMIDQANEGKPAIVANDAIKVQKPDSKDLIQQLKLFSANEYITDKLLEDHSRLLRNFDSEVGIPTPSEKKERMVQSEVESRQIDSTARCRVWYDTLKSSCDIINKHFGLSLKPVLTIDELEKENAKLEEEEDDNDEATTV